MRIAVAVDDGKTITQHFGRVPAYRVFTIENGEIVEKGSRDKTGYRQFAHEPQDDHNHEHGHGSDAHASAKHTQMMIELILDCACVSARNGSTTT